MSQHAVIVYFEYGQQDLQPIFDLEDRLEAAIKAADVGEFDGNEIATDGSDGMLFMYGPDADKLYEVVFPILETETFLRGATVRRRYGPADDLAVKEARTIITI